MLKRTLILTALLVMATAASAQEGAVVWTGGIGVEERDSAPKDGTKLVFFADGGKFLSNVQVVVKDAGGKEVVNAKSTGPWMVLKLEPGTYNVRATLGEQAQGGRIEVTAGNQEFAYMFKAQ
jgi:hypothetical protein